MSEAAGGRDDSPHGLASLSRQLSVDELDAAPVLGSIDTLLIHDLTEDEDAAFAAALDS